MRTLPAGAERLQGHRAGVVSRTIAMAVDAACVLALTGAVHLGVVSVRFLRNPVRFRWSAIHLPTLTATAILIAVVLLTASWTGLGRSPGMRFMGLRIRGPGGRGVGLGRSLLRAVTCVVFPLGLFWSAFSRRNASAQDLVFGTSVLYDWEPHMPDAGTD